MMNDGVMENGAAPMRSWMASERPREKFREMGAGSLTDAELLSIVIQNGNRQRSALDIGRDLLLRSKNSLVELGRLSVREIMKVKGIGMAKAITISAAWQSRRSRDRSRVVRGASAGQAESAGSPAGPT